MQKGPHGDKWATTKAFMSSKEMLESPVSGSSSVKLVIVKYRLVLIFNIVLSPAISQQ